jgi:hypothetical protein
MGTEGNAGEGTEGNADTHDESQGGGAGVLLARVVGGGSGSPIFPRGATPTSRGEQVGEETCPGERGTASGLEGTGTACDLGGTGTACELLHREEGRHQGAWGGGARAEQESSGRPWVVD